MFGTGMHHDPLLSSRSKAITNWGHSWVVLGVIVELPFRRGHYYCLPILFRLYLNQKSAVKHRRAYRTRPELAVEMLELLCNHQKPAFSRGRRQRLRRSERALPLADELRSDEPAAERCAVYGPRPERTAGTKGRPRKRGERTADAAGDAGGSLSPRDLGHLRAERTARLAERVAYVHAAPEGPWPVVAAEATRGGRGQEVFYSTCWMRPPNK